MAGAILKFSNGWMGIERCADNGVVFLMAHIYSHSQGRRVSAPIDIESAEQFALDLMKQAIFARGYTQEQIEDMGMERIIETIKAERTVAGTH